MRLGTIKSLALDRVNFVLVAEVTGGLPKVVEEFPSLATLFERYDQLVSIDEDGSFSWQMPGSYQHGR